MEKEKDRIEEKWYIAITISFLIGTPCLIMFASQQNGILTLIDPFINISTLIDRFTLPNIIYFTSILLKATLRVFACSFSFGICVRFYREASKSSGFARLKKSFVFGLQAGFLAVPIAFPYVVARVVAPILGNGLAS